MRAKSWMPFYFADYLADTGHLSTVEHGAYFLLIAHYWAHGKLPDDEAAIARITRMTVRQWSHSRDVLRSFFGDDWSHKRLDEEIAKSLKISEANSAKAKLRHRRGNAAAPVRQTQPQPQPQSKIIPIERGNRKKPATRLPDDWRPTNESIEKAKARGLTPREIAVEADKFRNHARQTDRTAVRWDAAFDNWCISAAERLGREPPTQSSDAHQAMPGTPEFDAWRTHFRDKNDRAMLRQLDQRQLEGRPFAFSSRWPPGMQAAE